MANEAQLVKSLQYQVLSLLTISSLSLPQEEREVLSSIYESDECFKEISPSSYSYRVIHKASLVSTGMFHTYMQSVTV